MGISPGGSCSRTDEIIDVEVTFPPSFLSHIINKSLNTVSTFK